MDFEEQKYFVELVQDRMGYLKLGFEQGEKILKYEKEREFYTDDTLYSTWEELDYELFVFSEILNEEQLKIYNKERARRLKYNEKNLIERDNSESTLRNINYKLERIQYLEKEFLPYFLKDFSIEFFRMLPHQKTKYTFLKEEFSNYLMKKKREIILQHFRNSRNFQPNELRSALLQHKLDAMLPHYPAFRVKMDEAAKAVADTLKDHFWIFEKKKDFIASKLEALQAFNNQALDRYINGLNVGSMWVNKIDDNRSSEEKHNDLYFSLILIDKDYYDYK